MIHFYGIFLNRDVPENRGDELCTRMAQAFDRETYGIHNAAATGRLCLGFAVPNKLAGRVAKSDLLLQRDGITMFGDIRLYNGDALKAGGPAPPDGDARENDISVLHRFVRNGGDPGRLNGDFAFGTYDQGAQQLTLVRDQIGNRILYYAQRSEGLVFSTWIQTFFRIGMDRTDLDPMALASYLVMASPGAGKTYYRSIMELDPAHRLMARPDGLLDRKRYWSLQPHGGLGFKRDDDWIGHIREAFVRAVSSRLRDAERPGVQLSGGLDSSAIAGAMCAEHPQLDIRAFAHVPGGPYPALEDDDAPYLRTVADKWQNLALTSVTSDRFDIVGGPDYWDSIAASPCVDPFQFAEDALAEAQMDQDVDVVLTGEGGDDSLSGYPDALLVESLLAFRPGDAWNEFRRQKTSYNWPARKIFRRNLLSPIMPPAIKNAYRSLAGRPWHGELALNGHYSHDREFLKQLERNGFPHLVAAPLSMREQMRRSFSPALSPLVAFGNRFAGNRGFQVRHPMHDTELLQSVCSAPARLMVSRNQERALLRRVAAPFLPDNVRDRPGKAPFVPDYFVRFENAIPALKSQFSIFETSVLWSSICDARKPGSFLQQIKTESIEDSDFSLFTQQVLMPYFLGRFLTSRHL